jgi:hypothetical protein
MSMVGIWFGIPTNWAVHRGSLGGLLQPIRAVKALLARWNEGAKPAVWTTTADQIVAKFTSQSAIACGPNYSG